MTPVGESSVSIKFDVNKGEKITIRRINFIGAKKLDKDTLQLDLANKEADFMGWLPFLNDGEAHVDQLAYDAYRLKDTYMKHGYIDAYVSKPLMRVDFGSYNAKINYLVHEGEQYRIGNIEVESDIDALDEKRLKSMLVLHKGKIFNIKKMRRDMRTLKTAAGDLGYAYARVIPQMHKDEEKHTIDLKFVIQGGDVVTINDVLISGNNQTKDRVIRRYLYLAPGDKYSATDLQDSRNALGRTGFFESVKIEEQRISEDKINLLVKVKEAPTGTISVGGGYSTYEKAIFTASVSDKNFLGTGIAASLGLEFSRIKRSYTISLTNPRVWDSLYSLSLGLSKRHYEYPNFITDTKSASLVVGREFMRYWHISAGVQYVDNNSRENNDTSLLGFEQNLSLIDPIGFYSDRYKKSSVLASLSFDNTDDYYVPRSGMVAALNFEFASLSGDDVNLTQYPGGYGTFTKVTGKFGYFYGLEDWIDYDLILRFKARAAMIVSDSDKKLPIAEKLFIGGAGSLRGYDPYSLSPGSSANYYGTGGKKSATFSLEASIPFSESAKMRLTGFYDYGMIGEESFGEIKRSSAGVVVEWLSGFGPINLIFAKALDAKGYDRTSTFEFTMGTKF